MTLLTEKRDVQDQLINHLIGIGWRYLPPGDVAAERGGDERQPFLPAVARRQLIALNPSTSLTCACAPSAGRASPGLVTEANVDDVLRRLRRAQPSLAGNETFLRALRGGWTAYDPAEKRERNLTLVDFDHPERNDFTFTQELPFVDYDRRRLDMALFVNGFPVVVVENKSPTAPEAELEAFDQVQRVYTECIPEFLKYVQFFAACDVRLHYGPTWNEDLKAFYCWKADGKDYGLERLSKTLFDGASLLRILQDYLIFFRADDQTQKYILRPHQMRAAERIVERVAKGIGPHPTPQPPPFSQAWEKGGGANTPSPLPSSGACPGRQAGEERGPGGEVRATTGLIWHTQGSGKTLTMIVAAHKLRRLDALANPTILVVVDRRELETQMVQNLEAFGFPMVERATSKQRLRQLLASDYRGLIVTLIHKFDRIPKNLNRRSNVVVLIDEAHRSQEGDLAVYMRAALPNAFYFGFTGTPVDRGKIGRGTFETFGKADPGGYQDKYGIDESIEDKTTVPLYYTLAPSELRLDRETLEEEFYRVVEEVGVASIEELNRLLDKADRLKAVLKAPARVEAIAAHVAEHFRGNVAPRGFPGPSGPGPGKAFLVAVDREACALYKDALDRHLPPEYSQVVYTPYHKDPAQMRRHHLDDEAEKQVRKAFRDPTRQPKILIVTEKLLTGYDAPVLYAMYLDKPLKDHTLLQAIARVNRPYPAKESGLIVDYIGIFEDLQRALAFDQAAISRALIDLAELKAGFADLMARIETAIAPIDLSGDQKDRVARILDHFFDQDRREAFTQDFRALQTAYEVISPDPFLRDYLDRYALAAQVYQVVYNYFDPEAERRKLRYDLLAKTDTLIRDNVEVVYLAEPLPLYPINRDLARVIAADGVSDQVKVINLYRSLMAHIQQNQAEQPYLVSIGEEVEAIIQRLRERQISAQMALQQIQAKAEEAVQAEAEQRQRKLPGKAFAFLWVLRGYGIPDAEAKAQEIEDILDAYPGWPYNQKIEQAVRFALHRALKAQVRGGAAQRTEAVNNLLKMHRTVMG